MFKWFKNRLQPDYHLLTPQTINELLDEPLTQAVGKQTSERIRREIENYEYYSGKQHLDPDTGQLVKGADMPIPPDVDYEPTRFSTNYFKSFIQKKAVWQMGGGHSINVAPKEIDDPTEKAKPDYEPSPKQAKENERAEGFESLLGQLWRENRMSEKLLSAARDRMIAGRVACKLMFNPRTGKLRWLWRPDTEVIPEYSDDDFEDLVACHFIYRQELGDESQEYIFKQSFTMEDDGTCHIDEAYYDQSLNRVEVKTEKQSLNLDFLPVVLFPVNDLSGEDTTDTETQDLRELNNVLNEMNEDATDSLKFEMFPMTAFLNVPPGTADEAQIAPGAAMEAQSQRDGVTPEVKKVEGGFKWKEAFKDQYARVKGAMHEVASLPQIVPQELNFGGLNGEALRVLFHDIISDTEEHWQTWGPRLEELHEKSVRYLQARKEYDNFAYDRAMVNRIGSDYDNEIEFQLPLPDNRKDKVDLLDQETSSGFESRVGAMKRLGVENPYSKRMEIQSEGNADDEGGNDDDSDNSDEGGDEE